MNPREADLRQQMIRQEVAEALRLAVRETVERARRELTGLPEPVAGLRRWFEECFPAPQAGLKKIRVATGFDADEVLDGKPLREYLAGYRAQAVRRAVELGDGYRHFLEVFKLRTGVLPRAIRATAWASSGNEAHRLWHEAEGGGLSDDEVMRLAGYLCGLQPAAFERPVVPLAVRRDVDVGDVAVVLELKRSVLKGALAALARVLDTHHSCSVAQWYAGWVRERLGRADLGFAWAEWEVANRRLGDLLELPAADPPEVVAREEECQSDAFLWLLVDCVSAQLFHDAAESEHFAELGVAAVEGRWKREKGPRDEELPEQPVAELVAAVEARWKRERSPEEAAKLPEPALAGMRALMGALKANALRRRNELDGSLERFGVVYGILKEASNVDPWIKGRVHKLYASLLYRRGDERQALRTLAIAACHFKKTDDGLERVRCAMERSSAWFARGVDPSPLLTGCIEVLEGPSPRARALPAGMFRGAQEAGHLSAFWPGSGGPETLAPCVRL